MRPVSTLRNCPPPRPPWSIAVGTEEADSPGGTVIKPGPVRHDPRVAGRGERLVRRRPLHEGDVPVRREPLQAERLEEVPDTDSLQNGTSCSPHRRRGTTAGHSGQNHISIRYSAGP